MSQTKKLKVKRCCFDSFRILSCFFAVLVATSAITGFLFTANSASADVPSCPFDEQQERVIVDFGGKKFVPIKLNLVQLRVPLMSIFQPEFIRSPFFLMTAIRTE
jgi:hypothetical protein